METQTSGSQEKRGQRAVRHDSMKRKKPDLSCDPDEPVKIHSDVKTEERFSHQNPSSCSQEHTTSLTSRYQQLKTRTSSSSSSSSSSSQTPSIPGFWKLLQTNDRLMKKNRLRGHLHNTVLTTKNVSFWVPENRNF